MEFLKNWNGTIEINGKDPNDVDMFNIKGAISIHLMPVGYSKPVEYKLSVEPEVDDKEYKIKVRAWMTKASTPDFNFMDKFNGGIPMPMRIMVGTVNKQTEKMYHMTLHGDILEEITQTCMCCGKPITNEVSKYFGMGPVCGQHNYVNPFNSKEELKEAVAQYKEKLRNITWTGWIPKSAIEEMVAI